MTKKRSRGWKGAVADFWARFRRSSSGMIGLGILAVFVLLAIFAPVATSYDPLKDMYLADRMARPAWLGIFPGYKDASRTIRLDLSDVDHWQVVQNTGFELTNEKFRETASMVMTPSPRGPVVEVAAPEEGGTAEAEAPAQTVQLVKTVPYSYEAPGSFEILFSYAAENMGDSSADLEVSLVSPGGEVYSLWNATVTGDTILTPVRIDSRDLILKTRLRLGLFSDVAQEVFKERGEYKLVMTATHRGSSGDADAPRIIVGGVKFNVLGKLHGVLGVDHMGADLWSQLVYGARISLVIGIATALIAVAIGTTIGIVSGYLGGVVDEVLMRIADIMLSIPTLPVLILLASLLGKSIVNIVILVSIFAWMGVARIVRSQTLTLKERAFVEAAKAAGAREGYVMFTHILPNVIPLVFASLVLSIPGAILYEASLSFLGLGDPRVPTWGRMLHNARGFGAFTELAWWWIIPPGLAITLLSLAFVLIGNTVDEILNPRYRER